MIQWIDVYDKLPQKSKDSKQLFLGLLENNDTVYTLDFDPTYGWNPKTRSNGIFDACSLPSNFKVTHWAEYNLPDR